MSQKLALNGIQVDLANAAAVARSYPYIGTGPRPRTSGARLTCMDPVHFIAAVATAALDRVFGL